MTLDTAISLVIIALLIPTIAYAVILNRKLSALRKSRDEFAKVIANFNDATLRAEAAIPKLKKATHEASVALKDRVEKAQALRDDLAFMIERAEEMATKLESGVRVARSEAAFGTTAAQPAPATTPSMLAGALRPAAPEPAATARAATPVMAAKAAGMASAQFEDAAIDLRNALNAARAEARVTEARQPAPAAAAPPLRAPRKSLADELGLTEDRSEAERELLKALQAGR